jgi:hypothetical protein
MAIMMRTTAMVRMKVQNKPAKRYHCPPRRTRLKIT